MEISNACKLYIYLDLTMQELLWLQALCQQSNLRPYMIPVQRSSQLSYRVQFSSSNRNFMCIKV
jgi:hypothetical protein